MPAPTMSEIVNTHEYQVNIIDDTCEADTQWSVRIPVDTDRHEIISAIETLYPTATFFSIEIVEKE